MTLTLTISLLLFAAIVMTGFVVVWLLFYARVNEGYFKPVRLSIAIIALIWIAYGVMK